MWCDSWPSGIVDRTLCVPGPPGSDWAHELNEGYANSGSVLAKDDYYGATAVDLKDINLCRLVHWVVMRDSAEIGRWCAPQWRLFSSLARWRRLPSTVDVFRFLCVLTWAEPGCTSVAEGADASSSICSEAAETALSGFNSSGVAVFAWWAEDKALSRSEPTSAQPMSSGPTASNAALPYSTATIGSATFKANVTTLAKNRMRRAGCS